MGGKLSAYPTQKEFFMLDIGAGDFSWGRTLMKFLTQDQSLPQDINVHVIGVRGERTIGDKIIEHGNHRLYELGEFKIEKLKQAFLERELSLENKIDFIVSAWTFRHLVDPVGTLVQTYDHLRKGGVMCIDGLMALRDQDNAYSDLSNTFSNNMLFLLSQTKSPFFVIPEGELLPLHLFVLKKLNESPYQLPLAYERIELMQRGIDSSSPIVIRFKTTVKTEESSSYRSLNPNKNVGIIFGDKSLYDWLNDNDLFEGPYKYSGPVTMESENKSRMSVAAEGDL